MIRPGTKVEVYWNLRKKLFSVRDRKTRLVIGHERIVVLADATFIVSEAGRQRCLREGRRNVHAYVRGTVLSPDMGSIAWPAELHYNPWRSGAFTDDDGTAYHQSDLVALVDGKIFVP